MKECEKETPRDTLHAFDEGPFRGSMRHRRGAFSVEYSLFVLFIIIILVIFNNLF